MSSIVRYGADGVKKNWGGPMLAERIEQPRAYTMEQSARLLNLSARKMDELVALKLIRSFKVGKSRRISADALEEFIKQQERAAR
jgi:excisionase family DNA binding protein